MKKIIFRLYSRLLLAVTGPMIEELVKRQATAREQQAGLLSSLLADVRAIHAASQEHHQRVRADIRRGSRISAGRIPIEPHEQATPACRKNDALAGSQAKEPISWGGRE